MATEGQDQSQHTYRCPANNISEIAVLEQGYDDGRKCTYRYEKPQDTKYDHWNILLKSCS